MKTTIKSLFISVLLFGAATFGLTLVYAGTAVAHDGEDHSKEDTAHAQAEEAPARQDKSGSLWQRIKSRFTD